ncbi:MAG TPA: adenine phosphoribosyltransferase [Oligoflexia bacterium]|nr:adenine phosphoribosyltransferase [Oligoflexia bacterium]
MEHPICDKLRREIRQVPDFPKPGINFYDITTILKNPALFHETLDVLHSRYRQLQPDTVVGMEARGFIFGSALAYLLKCAFVPVRKPGKLPAATERAAYSLEYGKDALEIHRDALAPGQRVIIIDDLLATGGTAKGTISLCERLGANVIECGFIIELISLEGRARLAPVPVISLIKFES